MKLKIQRLLFPAIALMLMFTACNEDDLGTPPRLFRPVVEGTVGGTWIKITWERYTGTNSYNIELSDAADFTNILANISTEGEEYTFENLWYNTQYHIRIQGIGDGITSEPVIYTGKTAKFPTKLLSPTASDCIDTQIRVKWEVESYDNLQVYIGKEYIKTIDLTAEDNDEKIVIIRDLNPSTTYTIQAYLGDEYLGEMDYNTVISQIIEGDYVDLRSLDPSEAYSVLTQTYFTELEAQYPNGLTVVLSGGTRYEFATINFGASVKFITGLSFEGSAILEDNGSFAIVSNANIPLISFDNIIFTDHPSSPRDAGNFGGRYVFNFNQANGKLGELILRNCDIRYKRGVIRAQVATQIDKITIENCVMDSLGGYGVTNADHAEAYFKEVVIKNTTISHAEKIAIASKPSPTNLCNSVIMENLTVCYAPKGEGNYIIDYNNQTLPGGITIKNCIFGIGWDSKIRGMRSATTNITVDGSFRTSDLEWTLNASTGEAQNPISDLERLSETTTALFADPQNTNFKITNSALLNKVGDPRWWK
ncbi:MAG: fibronectin type III domain-containing protein [Dysgonamonadaceae bacterium]|jgi:hypothetical protein|nr:fibronectin type III domain-containing protein [Dysgonamonadaceae bacterium]